MPDHGVPATTGPFIDFILETRKAVKSGDTFGPVVVHCRLGKNLILTSTAMIYCSILIALESSQFLVFPLK